MKFTHNSVEYLVSPRSLVPGPNGTLEPFRSSIGMTDDEFEAACAEFDLNEVRHQRAAAYPPLADFADAWVKNDSVALEAYRAACQAVKAKYPKPE